LYKFLILTRFVSSNISRLFYNLESFDDDSCLKKVDSEHYWTLSNSRFKVGFLAVMRKILRTERLTAEFLLSIPQRLSSFIKRRDIYHNLEVNIKGRNWYLTQVARKTDGNFSILQGKAVGVIYQKALRNYYIVYACGFRNYLSIPLLASMSYEENNALTMYKRSKNSVIKRTQLLYSDFFKRVLKNNLTKFKQFSKYRPLFNSRFRVWLDYYVQHQPYWNQFKTTFRKQQLEQINRYPSSFSAKNTFEFLYSRAFKHEHNGLLGSVNIFKYTNSLNFQNGKTWSINKLSRYFLRQNILHHSMRQEQLYLITTTAFSFDLFAKRVFSYKFKSFMLLLKKFSDVYRLRSNTVLSDLYLYNFFIFFFIMLLLRHSVIALLNISFFLNVPQKRFV